MMTTNNELLILRKQLGRAIAQLRTEANLSVRELSARCGIHYTSINKLEKGNYNASIDIINTLLTTLKYQLTMEKRNYTIELEEDKIEYLRNLKSEYIYNEEDDEYYKPTYELTYDYAENYNREFIAEYDNLDEALANITRRGDEKSNDYYAPTTILGIKLEICYRDEDGDMEETGEFLRNCEISGTPIEDWYLGECRFRPASEEMAERNSKLADELNELIPSAFNNQTGEYNDTSILLEAKNFDIETNKNNHIKIYDDNDDYFGSIVFKLDSDKLEIVIFARGEEHNKTISINNYTASEIVHEIGEILAEVLGV